MFGIFLPSQDKTATAGSRLWGQTAARLRGQVRLHDHGVRSCNQAFQVPESLNSLSNSDYSSNFLKGRISALSAALVRDFYIEYYLQ